MCRCSEHAKVEVHRVRFAQAVAANRFGSYGANMTNSTRWQDLIFYRKDGKADFGRFCVSSSVIDKRQTRELALKQYD